jgi:hypothetical protein
MPLPSSTAEGNEDAVRQANANAFFFSLGSIFAGVDDALVMDPSTKRDGLLGPTDTLGVDIGVGANGEVYLRGTAQATGPNTRDAAQTVASGRIGPLSPMGWLVVAVVAYIVLK